MLDYLTILEEKLALPQVQAPPALLLMEELCVCPQSVISMECVNIMKLQADCQEYHISPFANVWSNNPNVVIEGFDAVKEGSNLYLRWSHKESENKADSAPQTIPIGRNRHKR